MDTAKQKVIAQKLLENDISAISYMLEQPQGRYFLSWLFAYCKINTTTYSILKAKMLK